MICPHCHVSNPDAAACCVKCGVTLTGVDEDRTIVGESGTGTSASPIAHKPAAAAGLASPPPGSGPDYPPSEGSRRPISGVPSALEAGAQFGPRYRIESLIGEGGMGTVYKARDNDLDRIVALKLVRTDLTSEPEVMQRFMQELQLASKISHKNVLRIHDLGDVAGKKFISMAYVEGEDLHHVLKKEGRLPVDRAVRITRQLCGGLEAAHTEGVVHRDLKPHNILIDKSGNAYISDFGLAKSLEAGAAHMTRTGQFLGTPRYMSPEQAEGKPVDDRSDLYSLGLIMYEMATGDVPFTGDSTLQVMFQRVLQKPKNPKLLNPDLPDYLVRIILRCLEKEPAQRYQHANEILADLEAERAPAPSRSLQISMTMPSRRTGLIAAGATLVLLLLAFAAPPVRNFILRRRSQAPTAPAQVKYLAVLPFRILGDQKQLGYIAEGLVEALSAKLFQMKSVHVASAAAVQKAGKDEPLEKIAHELGVNLVIQGTLQGSGNKIRITMHLEDVTGARRLWTQEFSGVPQDLLTLEDQIYGRLVEALELKPDNEELARSQMHPTENVKAYDLYLRGRNTMRGQQEVKNIRAAIGLYEDALKTDPGFALAYAGVADAALVMYQETKDSVWSQKAVAAAEQGQRLNDNLAEVHFSLGSAFNATGKVAEAIVELKRALEFAPNSDEGYRRLGAVYLASGRKEEAIQAYRKAIEINPYYWVNYNWMGNTYYKLGEYEKALVAYRRMTELEPNNAFGYVNIGAVYFQQGKYLECIPWFQKALALQPYFRTYSNLGTVYFYLGRYNEAVPMFEKAVEMQPSDQKMVGNLADAYRWAGKKEKASGTYDRAITLALKELQVNPRKASTMGNLALYYAKKGDTTQASSFMRRARSIDPNNVQLIYYEAEIQSLASRPEEALKTLREAFQKGYSPEEAKSDPELKSLQSRPQFEKLVRDFSKKAS